jgi:hypothetical protein
MKKPVQLQVTIELPYYFVTAEQSSILYATKTNFAHATDTVT